MIAVLTAQIHPIWSLLSSLKQAESCEKKVDQQQFTIHTSVDCGYNRLCAPHIANLSTVKAPPTIVCLKHDYSWAHQDKLVGDLHGSSLLAHTQWVANTHTHTHDSETKTTKLDYCFC